MVIKKVVPSEARTRGGNVRYLDSLRQLSRDNRKKMTKAEGLFWHMILKGNQLNYRFLRQKPIGRCILDFYCSKLSLAIEIDGSSHELKENLDLNRDEYLSSRGIKTIRYTNDQIVGNLENVFEDMKRQIEEREKELELRV